jgi:tape measure domain-containing protein
MAKQQVIVSVLAETKQFSNAMKNLSNEIGLTKLTDGFKTAGSKVASFFTTSIKWAGAFGLAMAALAVKGGIDRLLNIENAEAKLRGLGHTTQTISAVMDDALKSVKGTSFGLDSAATAAASAMAAGIKPGVELQKYITRLGDAATIAGVSMDDMSSIFGKVATANRAQTTEINQIADRGIPIWAKLAEQYGVTQEELRKMVSAGKVDAQSFYDAMDSLVGGAALTAGDTTQGAFANMKAALSRVGAALVGTVFPLFKTAFQGITGWLDTLTDKIAPVGEAFGAWITKTAVPAVQKLATWVSTELMPVLSELWKILSGAVKTAISAITGALDSARASTEQTGTSLSDKLLSALKLVGTALATLITALGTVIAFFIRHRDAIATLAVVLGTVYVAWNAYIKVIRIAKAAMTAFAVVQTLVNGLSKANAIGLIVTAVAALVAGLIYFFTQTEKGKAIVTAAWSAIQTAVGAVVAWWQTTVQPAITAVWSAIQVAASIAAAWYQENVAPVIAAAGELISAAIERIGSIVTWLWTTIFEPYMNLILAGWSLLWEGVKAAWEVVGPPLISTIQHAWEHIKIVLTGVWNVLSAVFSGVWNTIKNVVTTALGVIKGIIKTATAIIKGDWSGAWNGIKSIFTTIWNGLTTALRTAITTIANVLKTVKDTITNVFSNAGSWLSDAGRKVVQGLIDGLGAMFQKVKDKLASLTSFLPSWKGPPKKDATLLRDAGKLIIGGFIDGLESQFGAVEKSLVSLTSDISKTDMGDVALKGNLALELEKSLSGSLDTSAKANQNAPINNYNITVQSISPTVEVGRAVVSAIQSYNRLNGVRS